MTPFQHAEIDTLRDLLSQGVFTHIPEIVLFVGILWYFMFLSYLQPCFLDMKMNNDDIAIINI